MLHIQRAQERGLTQTSWLESYHSFSFGEYYDESRTGFGALRVFNDDLIAPGKGFGLHGHANMEIITIVLEGSLEHQDSMGNKGTITPGEVQVMSAGTGIKHAEVNQSKTEELALFQIWIEPNKKGTPPSYDQKRFVWKKNTLTTIVSPRGPLKILQDASLFYGWFNAKEQFTHTIPEGKGIFLMIIDGSATIEKHNITTKDALEVKDANEIVLTFKKETKFVMIQV